MVQQVKMLAAKPDSMSFTLSPHIIEGKTFLSSPSLISTYRPWHTVSYHQVKKRIQEYLNHRINMRVI